MFAAMTACDPMWQVSNVVLKTPQRKFEELVDIGATPPPAALLSGYGGEAAGSMAGGSAVGILILLLSSVPH